jgi:4-hydroxy-2-oxoheptanedioate aldolase
MAFSNPILAGLADGGRVLGTFCVTGSPMAAEAMVTEGVDFVAIDMQHGAPEMGDLRAIVTAVESRGVPAVARVAVNDPTIIGRALDLGCLAVIVPLVEDADGAARAVAAARYAPHGSRSYGPSHVGFRHGTWDPRELERVGVFVMVETARGLANVRQIAGTPGLDGIVVGPSDLAIALGHDAFRAHQTPPVVAAILAVRDACREAGTAAGIICPSAEVAVRYLAEGFRFVTVTTDVALLLTGMREHMARVAEGWQTPSA